MQKQSYYIADTSNFRLWNSDEFNKIFDTKERAEQHLKYLRDANLAKPTFMVASAPTIDILMFENLYKLYDDIDKAVNMCEVFDSLKIRQEYLQAIKISIASLDLRSYHRNNNLNIEVAKLWFNTYFIPSIESLKRNGENTTHELRLFDDYLKECKATIESTAKSYCLMATALNKDMPKENDVLCELNCDGLVYTDDKIVDWCKAVIENIDERFSDDLDNVEHTLYFYREQGYQTICLELYDDETDNRCELIFIIGDKHNFSTDIDGGLLIEVPDAVEALHMVNLVCNTLRVIPSLRYLSPLERNPKAKEMIFFTNH